jgi:hypothetical protein
MLQHWQYAFPAEPVERPEQKHIELSLRCGGKDSLELDAVGNLAGFVSDVLGDDCPAALNGELLQLAQLILNFLAFVTSADTPLERNAPRKFGCRLRVRSEG